ncbi:MAG: hypothetical protein DMG75_04935 [Acidobacteria bacterium]|nr:MAG: hypothetical protein DMG75_04935 [Acidobacteriota bacterium]
MRMPLYRRILSCVIIAIVPAAMFAADTGAAMLYTNGTTWLNGAGIPKSSAVFAGDLIQTKGNSVANINAVGSSVMVLADSMVEFEGNAVKLEHGGVTVSTSKALATHAGDLTVTPATNGWTDFDVKDVDGDVHIAARKGDVLIADESETTTLPQGQQTSLEESSTTKKKKKWIHRMRSVRALLRLEA